MSDGRLSKKEARALGRGRRAAIEAAARAGYDQAIYERLCGFIRDRGAFDIILSYVSLAEEVDTLRIFEDSAKPRHFAVPRVEGDEMHFYEITSAADLAPGYRGIPEPKRHCHRIDPETSPHALIIVPGLSFTRDGRRAGYGGGYFDRFLSAHPALLKAGLAYSVQILPDFETEPTDIRMDYIITERELISVSPEPRP